jgi:hypothetical protein
MDAMGAADNHPTAPRLQTPHHDGPASPARAKSFDPICLRFRIADFGLQIENADLQSPIRNPKSEIRREWIK